MKARQPENLAAALRRLLAAAPQDNVLVRRSERFCSSGLTAAAVLIGIAPDAEGCLSVLLTRRADGLRHHGGQIAFPGGKIEAGDADALDCVLRETREETAVPPHEWQTVGALPRCCTPSGFAITPILACAAQRPLVRANEGEVAEAFWLPLSAALDTARYVWREYPVGAVPFLHWQGYEIWGATALMLYYLAECGEKGNIKFEGIA